MKDLRSELVKIACLTVAELSAVMTQGFELFAEYVLPSLLDAPKISIEVWQSFVLACDSMMMRCWVMLLHPQIVRTSADSCIQSILWNSASGFPKLLPK